MLAAAGCHCKQAQQIRCKNLPLVLNGIVVAGDLGSEYSPLLCIFFLIKEHLLIQKMLQL